MNSCVADNIKNSISANQITILGVTFLCVSAMCCDMPLALIPNLQNPWLRSLTISLELSRESLQIQQWPIVLWKPKEE